MSQYSRGRSRSRSRPHSTAVYPAFASSRSYALVRDFAYDVFHPMHYGAEPEPSGESTPNSEWSSARRQSDPMEQWNSSSNSAGGWSAGPWGGDGVMYEDSAAAARADGEGESLPSTSFGSDPHAASDPAEDDASLRRRHRKSKSYTSIADFERGRRRESGHRGRGDASDGMFLFHGQKSDPAGRDSLRLSRGYSGTAHLLENGGGPGATPRRDPHSTSTLPNRSFHRTNSALPRTDAAHDEEQHIPLDAEPHATASPVRDSLGPEDEDLFAGLSLALYSFEPENTNELRLVEGQELLVSYRHGQGWLVASDPRTGKQGLVPEAYVRLIADIPGYDPATGQFVDLEGEEEEETEGDSSLMLGSHGSKAAETAAGEQKGGGDESSAERDTEDET